MTLLQAGQVRMAASSIALVVGSILLEIVGFGMVIHRGQLL